VLQELNFHRSVSRGDPHYFVLRAVDGVSETAFVGGLTSGLGQDFELSQIQAPGWKK